MKRKEALTFLELSETSTENQIKKRLEEKLKYYEGLSKNSPSAFLRRLNAQHLSTAILIQNHIHSVLPPQVTVPPGNAANKIKDSVNEEQNPVTMPVILSSALRASSKKEEIKEPFAFLVRHTENQLVKPFSLFNGKNYIGRKPHPSFKPFIALEEDEFVSKVHAVIYVDEEQTMCYIDDSSLSNEGKPSRNGTFLNGNKQRLTDKHKLTENDTIQVGETKLIFRMNTNHISKIVKEVEDTDYMNTVVIRRK
ncbi:MAG: FHA domain-containing protein [Ferruginibacter sp.]